MGRPGLTKHRKFIRLERILGSHVLARGSLETLWDACYENGDEFLGEALDVEGLARWEGESGKLAKALLSAGFIEEVVDHPGTFQVHDLWHHAPDYVAGRKSREMARKKPRPCEFCGTIFHSSEAHAKFCTPACKTSAYRARRCDAGVTEPSVTVTEPIVTVTERNVTVTRCDAPPSPSPSPSLSTSLRSERSCAAPGKPAPTPVALLPPEQPSVIELPCVGKGPGSWPVCQLQLDDWGKAYPGLDVLQEIRKARCWLEAAPTRGKTYAGMGRFLLGWLSRAQNTPRNFSGAARASPPAARHVAADDSFRDQVAQKVWPTLSAVGSP